MEYHTLAVAKSAMQNLAGRELNGRKIRVDSANQASKKNSGGSGKGTGGGGEFTEASSGGSIQHQQRQQPHQVSAGPSQHEAVRSALQHLTVYQIYDVLKQMKEVCVKQPEMAEKLLLSRPPLAQALLQAQQMFEMVHETVDGLELPTTENSVVPEREDRSSSQQRVPLPPQSSIAGGQIPVVPTGQPPLLLPTQPIPTQPPIAPPPPGYRIIQGFEQPVPEVFIQQAMELSPEQIAVLTPQQLAQLNRIKASIQQQQQQQQQQYGAPSSQPPQMSYR